MISATIYKDTITRLWCLVREYGSSEMTSFHDTQEEAKRLMWDRACESAGKPDSTDALDADPCEFLEHCKDDTGILNNILAILNGDGGHYQGDHGTHAAVRNGLRRHWEYVQMAREVPR